MVYASKARQCLVKVGQEGWSLLVFCLHSTQLMIFKLPSFTLPNRGFLRATLPQSLVMHLHLNVDTST